METVELTIQLTKVELDFAETYAKKHQLSVSDVIDRSLRLLQKTDPETIHPDLRAITGIIPADVNTEEEYYNHILRKHR